ncbi:MAG: hypothetical protein JNL90_18965 [Planctomycetes bacterium]|nr:hypothetical protein [Planctomycetota bacterium]
MDRSTFVRSTASLVAATLLAASPALRAQDCSKPSLGLVPLDDLREGNYRGVEGGLFPGRSNEVPADHLQAGRNLAKSLVPLDHLGHPASDGVIAFAAIGMSFTEQVFTAFERLARVDPEFAPDVALASLTAAAQDLLKIRDPAAPFWTDSIPALLEEHDLTAAQIQVVWLLEGTPTQSDPFPLHAEKTAGYWIEVLQIVKRTFPNAKLAFLTPLYWQGYSLITPAKEPYYYEQAWSIRTVVERQLAHDPEVEWDGERGPAKVPWLSWGPYLFCDGEEPRSDGLRLDCADFSPDGGHLGDRGMEKLGERLHHFVKSHRACTPWSIVPGSSPAERMADVEVIGVGTRGAQGIPRLVGDSLPTIPHPAPYSLLVRSSVRGGHGFVLIGGALLPGGGLPFAGGTLYVEPLALFDVTFDLAGDGVLPLDEIPDDPALLGLSLFAQLAALDRRGPDGQFALSAAIELRLGD